jgi:hypothetical protein
MANVHSLKLFPFCIPEKAEDGLPFEQWDGTTYYPTDLNFDNKVSKSPTEFITVYGNGTPNFIGPLTLDELMTLYWRPKIYRASLPEEFSTSVEGGTLEFYKFVPQPFPLQGYYEFVREVTEVINKTFSQKNEAGADTYDRSGSHVDETSLVCFTDGAENEDTGLINQNPFRFDFLFEKENNTTQFAEFAANKLVVYLFSSFKIDFEKTIKVSEDSYYAHLGGQLNFSLQRTIRDVIQPSQGEESNLTEIVRVFYWAFPVARINTTLIGLEDDAAKVPDNNELKFRIHFPNGTKEFSTNVFRYANVPVANEGPNYKFSYEIEETGPMFSIDLKFPEYWEYDPNDGKGPIYDKLTGAKIRNDV